MNLEYAEEYIKCRDNPLYFIFNYVNVPTYNGCKTKLSIEKTPKVLKRMIRLLYRHIPTVSMSSRGLDIIDEDIILSMITWGLIFYPGNTATILSANQNRALVTLSVLKEIILELPQWMIGNTPFKSKSEIQSYITLFNDSRVDVFYPSTVHTPNALARSLTGSMLFIQDAAFIKNIKELFNNAQQTLAFGYKRAKANKYPHFCAISSVPNGITGIGKWFYDRWSNSLDSDCVFGNKEGVELINNVKIDRQVNVKHLWYYEKDGEWFHKQVMNFNNNIIAVESEIQLRFINNNDAYIKNNAEYTL